jgi:Protein of unknown function (DUF1615)
MSWRSFAAWAGIFVAAWVSGCAGDASLQPAGRTREQIRADIQALVPSTVPDRAGWAADLQAVLEALRIEPSDAHVCAVLAVTEQESTYRTDPPVPDLARIAREEIMKRADRAGVPALAVRVALQLQSPNGRTYDDRLDAVKTEQELSRIYEDFTDEVPLGRRLLAGWNPVRTGGPMQVSIAFAEAHAKARLYPFNPKGSVRDEVFTRRGGLYFGAAHLLDYPANYGAQMIFRFADFNAGHYAARNAAFQQAVATATGRALDLDGDLVAPGGALSPGQTETAVRSLGAALGMDAREIRRDLDRGDEPNFDRSPLLTRVYALAEQRAGRKLPRAVMPSIVLQSPKIRRQLTTEWFARRVDERYQRCLRKAAA